MAVTLAGSKDKVEKHMNFSVQELLDLLSGERELTSAELGWLTTLLVNDQADLISQNQDLRELVSLLRTHRPK